MVVCRFLFGCVGLVGVLVVVLGEVSGWLVWFNFSVVVFSVRMVGCLGCDVRVCSVLCLIRCFSLWMLLG